MTVCRLWHPVFRLSTSALLLIAAVTDARQLVTLSEFTKVALLTPTTTRAAALSIACPLACAAAGLVGNDFDPSLLSLIIAVPSSISINAAYTRRERALTCLPGIASSTRRTCALAQRRLAPARWPRWAPAWLSARGRSAPPSSSPHLDRSRHRYNLIT